MSYLENYIIRVALDSDPIETTTSLDLWQKDFFLPRCGTPANIEDARAEVLALFLPKKPFRQEKIQELANLFGVGEVLLERVGPWHLNLRFLDYESVLYAECGKARCGKTLLGARIKPLIKDRARCGKARCGKTLLFNFGLPFAFFCLLNRQLPAWVRLDYDFTVD